MNLQELQTAIQAYSATITTEEQAEELYKMLSNEADLAEQLSYKLLPIETDNDEKIIMIKPDGRSVLVSRKEVNLGY